MSRGALVIFVRKFGWVDVVRLKKNYKQMYGKLEKSAERPACGQAIFFKLGEFNLLPSILSCDSQIE